MNQHIPFDFTLQWKNVTPEDKMILILEDSSNDRHMAGAGDRQPYRHLSLLRGRIELFIEK